MGATEPATAIAEIEIDDVFLIIPPLGRTIPALSGIMSSICVIGAMGAKTSSAKVSSSNDAENSKPDLPNMPEIFSFTPA